MPTFSELINSGLLAVGDGYRAKNDELGDDGPIFLRSAYLQDSGWVLSNPDRLASQRDDFGPKVARIGDTVLTTKGNSLGRLGFVDADVAGAIYSPHLSYWRSLNYQVLDPRFLYYWSNTAECLDQVRAKSYSTDMAPYLSLADQGSINLDVPLINQQQLASNVLGVLDDKIALNRRMVETLENLARTVFQSWCVDFEPTSVTADQNSGLPSPLTARSPSRLPRRDDLPAGWRLAPLSAIATTARATVDPTSLGSQPLLHLSLPAFDRGQRPTLEPASAVKSLKLVARRGMILFSKLNPHTPRIWVVPEESAIPMVASTEFVALTPTGAVPASFLWSLLSSPAFVARATSMVTGTSKSHQRVQPASLMTTEWPLPLGPILAAFDALVAPLMARIEALRLQSATLAMLRNTLLPKLISGELQADDRAAIAASA